MKVLVTGATGAIGRLLVRRLLEKGFDVRIFVRASSDISCFDDLSGRFEVFRGELLSEKDLCDACESIDIVFHLAAKLHINRPSVLEQKEIYRINLDSTRLLCRAAWKKHVKRLVFFSTINVYGVSDGKCVFDENSISAPLTAYSRSKFDAEKYVLGLSYRGNNRNINISLKSGVVLRYSAVYGSGMKGNYRLLHKLADIGIRILPGNLQNRRTLIHEEDAVKAAIAAALHPDTAGKIFNITDGYFHTVESVYASMMIKNRMVKNRTDKMDCADHGFRNKKQYGIRGIPISVLRPVLTVLDVISEKLTGRKPFIDALSRFTEDIAVDGFLFINTAGFRPEYILERWK